MAESLKCSGLKHVAEDITLVQYKWSLNCTFSGVATGAGEATEVFPRPPKWAASWQDGVSYLSVVCHDKICHCCCPTAVGQLYFVVETSISRIAAILPS